MSIELKLVNDILKLTEEFSARAEAGKADDPLFDAHYTVKITSPYGDRYREESKSKGIHIELVIVYASGHSEESAHVLNDIASFILADGKIMHIVFENQDRKALDDIELTEDSAQEFIQHLRRFCERILPPKAGWRNKDEKWNSRK